MHLIAYDESNTAISHELEELKHENALLHSGTLPPLSQGRELKVAYHRLRDAEHGWNYDHQHLDTAREEVDSHTHMIIHLEHTNEQQGHELEERASMTASLEQQLQVLQLQAPPAPTDPTEPDVVSDDDEE
jgi:hypothetical protein